VHVTLRADVGRGLSLFASLNGKWTVVRTYEGSLLEEHAAYLPEDRRPVGLDGGPTVLVAAGLIYDTRRPEVEPRRGVLAEVSGQYAIPLPWGQSRFGGAFFALRGYRAVAPWLVFAGRVMVEMLAGQVPFYEMVHWRGSTPVAGFGGFETVRGVSFGRWRAPSKAVANAELRFRLIEHRAFRRPMEWQLGLFCDAGVVWGAGERATAPDPDFPIHVSGGAGIRLVFDRSFVGRVDVGFSNDPVREFDGSVSNEFQYGIYVVFDQAF
jgi:outer membrane protein assembly factor BamA